jgi:hypothetical protein
MIKTGESILKLFDRKISDTTKRGLDIDEMAEWLHDVEKIDEFRYYYFELGAKRPYESKKVKGQPVKEALGLISTDFAESINSYVEVQKKDFKSGRHQVIVRQITVTASERETTKIAVLNYSKA